MNNHNTPAGGEPLSPDLLPRNIILTGDVRERLEELPSASVDCIVTSPPYWGVRDYGSSSQLGAEPTVDDWVNNLRAVCGQLARVLRPTGSLWLNLGDGYSPHRRFGAPRKSLLCGPERLLLALVADGWHLRNSIVWAKSNPMPSSIRDRLTPSHEMLYFLTRSPRYYFDLNAIRVPLKTPKSFRTPRPIRPYPPAGVTAPGRSAWTKRDNLGLARLKAQGLAGHPRGRNPGDVWQLPTAGFRGAHFAVFPTALIERPILATCPQRVCVGCNAPWRSEDGSRRVTQSNVDKLTPSCGCNADWRPGLVLDPFLGSGTVGVVAERLHRDWLGIELNPAYVELATQRIDAGRAGGPTTNPPHAA